ncbi:hypothetical protein MKW98_016825, partial [Papaver atlanticum]
MSRDLLDQSDAIADHKVSFLFSIVKKKSRIYYGDYDENRKIGMKLDFVNHPYIEKHSKRSGPSGLFGSSAMVGSCNGLVCVSVPYTNHINDPIYICNPNLGEQISLPRFTMMARNKDNFEYKKTTHLDGHIVSG